MRSITRLRTLTVTAALGGTLAATALVSAPASATVSSATCPNVYQVVVRGSNEPAGSGASGNIWTSGGRGRMGNTAAAAATRTTRSVRTVSLNYPATILPSRTSDGYINSQYRGKYNLTKELNRMATACPSTRTVLIGYSQGAHVIGDVVSNGNPMKLSSSAKAKIAAIFLTGDPVRRYGEPFNRGLGLGGGALPNRAKGDLSGVASRLISYCYKGDIFCDPTRATSQSAGTTVHGSYDNTFIRDLGANFIVAHL